MQGKAQLGSWLKSFESAPWEKVRNYSDCREFHGDTGGCAVPRVDRVGPRTQAGMVGWEFAPSSANETSTRRTAKNTLDKRAFLVRSAGLSVTKIVRVTGVQWLEALCVRNDD